MPKILEARVSSDEDRNLRFSRSVDEKAIMMARVHEHNMEVRNLRRYVGDFPETIEARGRASGDRISGFWSREVVEHVCGFGFIRQSLDLCRSDKLSHGLLGLLDFDTTQSHGGCEMS